MRQRRTDTDQVSTQRVRPFSLWFSSSLLAGLLTPCSLIVRLLLFLLRVPFRFLLSPLLIKGVPSPLTEDHHIWKQLRGRTYNVHNTGDWQW